MTAARLPLIIGDARVETPEWLPVDDRATGDVMAEVAAGRPRTLTVRWPQPERRCRPGMRLARWVARR